MVDFDQFANYSQVNLDGTLMEKIVCIQFHQAYSNQHGWRVSIVWKSFDLVRILENFYRKLETKSSYRQVNAGKHVCQPRRARYILCTIGNMGRQKKTPYRGGRAVSGAVLFLAYSPFLQRNSFPGVVSNGFVHSAFVTDIHIRMPA